MLISSKSLKIRLNSQQGFKIISSDEIVRLEAESNYTRLFLLNGGVHIASKTLKEFENQLAGHDFIRVHRSHLINMVYVEGYMSKNGGVVLMKDGAEVYVSRAKHKEFVNWTKERYSTL